MFGELLQEARNLTRHIRLIIPVGVVLACLAYVLTGLYWIDVNETGVLKRFGRVIDERVAPGMHYRLPWPIDRVERVGTRNVRRLLAGFGADPEVEEQLAQRIGRLESLEYGTLLVPYCIAGDKNIVHVKVAVRYRVVEPVPYLHRTLNPERVFTLVVQNAIIRSVAFMSVDDLLTTGRSLLQRSIQRQLEEVLEQLPLGVSVVSVEVARTRPPRAVDEAFRDVVRAQQDSVTTVHEAESYASSVLSEARGEADRAIAEARAYRARKIAHAEGKAKRFSLLATEYEIERFTTARRLYLEAMTRILPFIRTYVIAGDRGEDIVDLRFLLTGE